VTKASTSFRLSALTLRQLQELSERWGMTKTETISVVIDRAHREADVSVREQQIRAIAETIAEDPDPEAIRAQNVAGWTVDLGTATNYRRYNGVRLSETELAQAIAIADEIRRGR